MLDTEAMKNAIAEAIDQSGRTHAYIADQLGVSVQAITGWRRTGRIDKRRLPALARITGVPLSTFMPDASDGTPNHVRSVDSYQYGGIKLLPGNSAMELWAAYQAAPLARQRAVDLLLLQDSELSEVLAKLPALVGGVELLDKNAAEALTTRKSA